MDRISDFFRNNYMYVIWFIVYFLFTLLLVGVGIPNIYGFLLVLWIYVASLTVAFSHIGEEILRFINRVRQLETKREKNYLIPLFEDVYAEARKIYPNLTKDIEICIVDAMYINAFALGRKTVAVTRGAVDSLSEEELSGFISHELGHIANGDTKALLLTTVGNGIFTVFILIMQLIINIMSGMFARGGIAGFVAGLIKSLFNISLFFFFYIGQFILAINSRKNEYRADEFAYEIGYGDNLVEALYLLQGMCISDNAKIVDRLKASHPHIAKRIGRLETIIDEAEENLLTE